MYLVLQIYLSMSKHGIYIKNLQLRDTESDIKTTKSLR